MTNSISFSLIAPIYGVEKYIGKFAASVLGQTYNNIQFIFVNDGTTDSSMEILNTLIENKYRQLKDQIIIINKSNEGLPAARRTGMEYATGDYILHIDSDDWLEVDAVEKIAKKAKETDSDIIYFDFINEYGNRVKYKSEREYNNHNKNDLIVNIYNYKGHGYVWNKCFKREILTKHNVHYSLHAMHEDIYLMSQIIFFAKSITHLKEALYHYRKNNPHSISAQNRAKRRHASTLNFLDLFEKYQNTPTNENPVSVISGDIIMRAAWYSTMYNYGLFKTHPYITKEILKTRIKKRARVWFIFQVYLKIVAFFKLLSQNPA